MAKTGHNAEDNISRDSSSRIEISDDCGKAGLVQKARSGDQIDQVTQSIWEKALVVGL